MKSIMMLGGNLIQTTAIKAARKEGYYVISVDNIPGNPGHKFSNEYHNISTVNKDEVLELARKKDIDGIVSYGSDVSAPTAAYVAEKLGLPTNPYKSVMILTHKHEFRNFMIENGYVTPKYGVFKDFDEAKKYANFAEYPLIVKPVDSSGSKGVNRVDSINDFPNAWAEAIKISREKKILVEKFIKSVGYQIDGDIFVNEGKIVFNGLCDQHHDYRCAPYTPSGLSFPSIQKEMIQLEALNLIQSIFDKLNIKMGAFNIEYIVDENEIIHLIEIGPRNGGNFISDIINEATGIDLAKYTVRQAVGDSFIDMGNIVNKKCSCSYILHADKDGVFDGIEINEKIKQNIHYFTTTVSLGDSIKQFHDSAQGIGMMILNFETIKEMLRVSDNMHEYVKVKIKSEQEMR